jgi:hypothetical protein
MKKMDRQKIKDQLVTYRKVEQQQALDELSDALGIESILTL